MPIQPHARDLAARPVLATNLYGTLRLETPAWRYWLDDDDGTVWVEQMTEEGWKLKMTYEAEEMP